MTYPHPIIAREGWPFIAIVLVVALLIHTLLSFSWAWPFWLLTLLVVQFFRDPKRLVPQQPNAVLCPADGRIITVETSHDPYTNRTALRISVFMSVFNVHSQRSPIDGLVTEIKYFPGTYLKASIDKASLENERNAIILKSADNHIITLVQVAGCLARRILCYTRAGDQLARGQRYGFIRFGSRVDIYLPLGSKPRVSIGEKAQASTTILAEL
ncbi:phosphatidylserine decarboxylase [Candidatus Vallotiella sp. (ex Adelges kitamiensis)]|uniref:phosphatidylserine decarboxylase n=1 Tax=Candidatus Vallotiella sp. (ex Adelges kitamiensis) TaxID=2864217 RepID=UPI001CE2F411|nr:phosphatidylserine decarboxylase [Candidatus Vallotia sp. (ex Adelges kitamiensis)]